MSREDGSTMDLEEEIGSGDSATAQDNEGISKGSSLR